MEEKKHRPLELLGKGILFGIANVIPGVSGGTLAVITGVYESFMEAISHFIKHWKFLFFYFAGAGIGIIAAAFGLEKLFELWPIPTLFAFMGFILGGIPALWKKSDFQGKVKVGWIIGFALSFLAIITMEFFLSPGETTAITEFSISAGLWIFLAAMAGASAMVVPGVSGSFILLLLGMYTTFISAVTQMNILFIIIILAGIACGLLITAKIISYLLKRNHQGTYAVILGLVVASMVVLWPGIPRGWQILASILTLGLGLLGGYKLGDR